jgi:hypothetical protein
MVLYRMGGHSCIADMVVLYEVQFKTTMYVSSWHYKRPA